MAVWCKIFLKPASYPILSAVCTQVVLTLSKMLKMQNAMLFLS